MKLEKCPFCEGEPEIVLKYDYLYTVQCKKCKCTTQHMPKERAINAWNKRPYFDYYNLSHVDGCGRRIRQLRRGKMKESLVTMAKSFGENWTVLSAWEHGNAEPSLDNIVKLAEYFGCTTDFLLKGSVTNGME